MTPTPAPSRTDPIRPAIQAAVYLLLYLLAAYLAGPLFEWAGGYLVGVTIGGLAAPVIANALSMTIFGGRPLTDVGFPWNRGASRNACIGLAGGIGAALFVLCLPLLTGAARMAPSHDPEANYRTVLFVPVLLLCGAIGEELLFHGFGFQVLLRRFGTYAIVIPVGVLFGYGHSTNPNVSKLGIANTMGFGILFGIAFLRSHDLWLPVGLHFGWNFTLPLFGVNLSGLTIKPTGYELVWTAGPIWSGGDYGPEASILTTGVLLLLFFYLWKVPVTRQYAPLYDSPPSSPSQPELLQPPTP
jgi:membrane protease YdiL (CAAX protease family)